MTELDLAQKVAARRLLWRMGYSTRIDVVLRAVALEGPGATGRRSGPESFTDLDVLGVAVTPSGEVQTAIVDCKTGGSPIITRMFWLRGLVELFKADSAYMVRDRPISADARQLASKLGLSALTETEVDNLGKLLQTELPVTTDPLSQLFDAEAVAAAMGRTIGLDGRLKPLLDYRQFHYWVYPEHQHLIGLVDALFSVKDFLKPGNPQHVGLLLDCAWLYLLSLARCVGAVRAAHISDLRHGLSQYLAGGDMQLGQKHQIAGLLQKLKDNRQIPEAVQVNVDPRFFAPLLELLTRLLRRGSSINDALRLLEFQCASALTGQRQLARDAFDNAYDSTAAKLAVDVVSFLVVAADLPAAFTKVARDVLTSSEHVEDAAAATPEIEDGSQLDIAVEATQARVGAIQEGQTL